MANKHTKRCSPLLIIQFSSVVQRVRLCDPMNCSTPGLPVHHQLPEFTQTHAHWVSDAHLTETEVKKTIETKNSKVTSIFFWSKYLPKFFIFITTNFKQTMNIPIFYEYKPILLASSTFNIARIFTFLLFDLPCVSPKYVMTVHERRRGGGCL